MRKKLLALVLACTLAMTSVLPAFAETTEPGDSMAAVETEETVETEGTDETVAEPEAVTEEVTEEVPAEETETDEAMTEEDGAAEDAEPPEEDPAEAAAAEDAAVDGDTVPEGDTALESEIAAIALGGVPGADLNAALDELKATTIPGGSGSDKTDGYTVSISTDDTKADMRYSTVTITAKNVPVNTSSDEEAAVGAKREPGHWVGAGMLAPAGAKSYFYNGTAYDLDDLGNGNFGFGVWVNAGNLKYRTGASNTPYFDIKWLDVAKSEVSDDADTNGHVVGGKPVHYVVNVSADTTLAQTNFYPVADEKVAKNLSLTVEEQTGDDIATDTTRITVSADLLASAKSAQGDGHEGKVDTDGYWVGVAFESPTDATAVMPSTLNEYRELKDSKFNDAEGNEHTGYILWLDAAQAKFYTEGYTIKMTWASGTSDSYKIIREATYVIKFKANSTYTPSFVSATDDVVIGETKVENGVYSVAVNTAAGKTIAPTVSGEGFGNTGFPGYWVGVGVAAPEGAVTYVSTFENNASKNSGSGDNVDKLPDGKPCAFKWVNAGNPDYYTTGLEDTVTWFDKDKHIIGQPVRYVIKLQDVSLALPEVEALGTDDSGEVTAKVTAGIWKDETDEEPVDRPVIDVFLHAENVKASTKDTYGYWVGVNLLAPVQGNDGHDHAATGSVTYTNMTSETKTPNESQALNQSNKGKGFAAWINAGDANLQAEGTGCVYKVAWNYNSQDSTRTSKVHYRELYYRIRMDSTSSIAKKDVAVKALTNVHYDNVKAEAERDGTGTVNVTVHAENVRAHKSGDEYGTIKVGTPAYWVGVGLVAPEGATAYQIDSDAKHIGLDPLQDNTAGVGAWVNAGNRDYYADKEQPGKECYKLTVTWFKGENNDEEIAKVPYKIAFDETTTITAPKAFGADGSTVTVGAYDQKTQTVSVEATAKDIKRSEDGKYLVSVGLPVPEEFSEPYGTTKVSCNGAEAGSLVKFNDADGKSWDGYVVKLDASQDASFKDAVYAVTWGSANGDYITVNYSIKLSAACTIDAADPYDIGKYTFTVAPVTYTGAVATVTGVATVNIVETPESAKGDEVKAADVKVVVPENAIDAGEYTVDILPSDSAAGVHGKATAKLVIKPYDLKSDTVTVAGKTFTNNSIVLTNEDFAGTNWSGLDANIKAADKPALGRDFNVQMPENGIKDVGSYEVTLIDVEGGNYTISDELKANVTVGKATVVENSLSVTLSSPVTFDITDADGSKAQEAVKSALSVKYNGSPVDASEYTVTVGAPQNGVVEVTVSLNGSKNYEAKEVTVNVAIERFDISKGFVTASDGGTKAAAIPAQQYEGQPVTLQIVGSGDAEQANKDKASYYVAIKLGKDNFYTLKKEQFEIGYQNNDKAGTATLIVHGTGNLTGMFTKTFKIKALPAKDAQISETGKAGFYTVKVNEEGTYTYDGTKKQPTVDVKYYYTDSAYDQIDPADYTLTYSNNINACTDVKASKAPTVNIKLKGAYSGTLHTHFTIKPLPLTKDNIELTGSFAAGKGKAQTKPKVVVTVNDASGKPVTLKSSQYKLTYGNNIGTQYGNTGAVSFEGDLHDATNHDELVNRLDKTAMANSVAYVLVEGKTNTTGTVVLPFNIAEGLDKQKIKLEYTSHVFEGNKLYPSVTVGADTWTYGGKDNAKFKVEYSGNDTVNNKATVTITGLFSSTNTTGYIGEVTKTFKITAAKPTSKNAAAGADMKDGTQYVVELPKAFNTLKYDGTAQKPVELGADDAVTNNTGINIYYKKPDGGYYPVVVNEMAWADTGTQITKIVYANTTNAADATDVKKAPTIKITLKGEFNGTVTKTFTIGKAVLTANEISVAKDTLSVGTDSKPKPVTPKVTVTFNGKTLRAGKSGEYTVTPSTMTFGDNGTNKIKEGQLTKWDDTTPGEILPRVIVQSNDKNFYIADPANDGKPGGSIAVAYRVAPKARSLKGAAIEGIDKKGYELPYKNGPYELDFAKTVTVKLSKKNGGITLKYATKPDGSVDAENTDFFVSYTNNMKKGTAKVTVTGNAAKGYGGSVTKTFKITPRKIDAAEISVELKDVNTNAIYYTGKAITFRAKDVKKGKITLPQQIIVKDTKSTENTLTYGKDYTVSYKNNKKAGTATIVIKGKGDYTGEKLFTFNIQVRGATQPV